MGTKNEKVIAKATLGNKGIDVIEVHLDKTVTITTKAGQRYRIKIDELTFKPHERRKVDYAITKKQKEKEKKFARQLKLAVSVI